MISDSLRLTPRLQRCLDALEHINGRIATPQYMVAAMYPTPADEPGAFETMLTVTVHHLRKKLAEAKLDNEIETVWGKGYRLVSTEQRGGGL